VIDHRIVSRLHAWIEYRDGAWFVVDARSRAGTRVNGQKISGRHRLAAGDTIQIGPARLTIIGGKQLPAGIVPFEIEQHPSVPPEEKGVLFECGGCNAPIFASLEFCGHAGSCQYCGKALVVPSPPRTFGRLPLISADESFQLQRNSLQLQAADSPPLTPPHPTEVIEERIGEAATVVTESRLRPSPPRPATTPADRPAQVPTPPASLPRQPAEPVAKLNGSGAHVPDLAAARFVPAPAVVPPAAIPPTQPTAGKQAFCGICQSQITMFEERTACPECGLSFHADCWAENLGCSAYGCSMVNSLAPKVDPGVNGDTAHANGTAQGAYDAPSEAYEDYDSAAELDAPKQSFPWEFLTLAGAVFGTLVGAICYGAPALLAALAALALLLKKPPAGTKRRKGVLVFTLLIALVGAAGGAAVSYLMFQGGRKLW
jgi:hypothetical protein